MFAENDFAPGGFMTVSVDDFILEAPMNYVGGKGRYEFVTKANINLKGRRVTVSTDAGGTYNALIR